MPEPALNQTGYDAIAEWYDRSVRGGLPTHALALPTISALTGDVKGLRVCDLGCGQGIAARDLARRGALVTGVDLSERLLEIARQEERKEEASEENNAARIVYRHGDAQDLSEIEAGAFDGVVCCMALIDMPDLPAVLRTTARILTPTGWFVFVITHPCFQTPDSRWTGQAGGTVRREVRGYFREGFWTSDNRHGVRGQVGSYHRTLSTYFNALTEAGFVVTRMLEPQADDETSGRVPGFREAPAVLAARCEKQKGSK